MKKSLLILISIMFVLSLAGVGAAEDYKSIDGDDLEKNVDATVRLTLSDTYTVTIPTLLEFFPDSTLTGNPYTSHGDVSATVNRLSADEYLYVNVTSVQYNGDDPSNNYWYILATEDTSDSDKYYYKMLVGESAHNSNKPSIMKGSEILTLDAPEQYNNPTTKSITLHLWLVNIPQHADVYEGTLTFQVGIGQNP